MNISPEIAREMLTHNIANNRCINHNRVNFYADMMKAGKFKLTPDPIAFTKNGGLFNGQHRLHSIIKSGITVQMLVAYDCPEDAFLYLDSGQPRSTQQAMTLKGTKITKDESSSLNFLIKRSHNTPYIRNDMVDSFFEQHFDSMQTAIRICKTGAHNPICKKAYVFAAVWCALMCGVPETILEKFCEVVNSGFYNSDEETAAIVFRKSLESYNSSLNYDIMRNHLFNMCQEAIYSFANRQSRRITWKDPKAVYYDGKLPEQIILGLDKTNNETQGARQ